MIHVKVQKPADDIITEQNSRPSLTAMDRCDRCGARAYVAANVSGTELMYCGHHARQYEPRLREIASSWRDEREQLAPWKAGALS